MKKDCYCCRWPVALAVLAIGALVCGTAAYAVEQGKPTLPSTKASSPQSENSAAQGPNLTSAAAPQATEKPGAVQGNELSAGSLFDVANKTSEEPRPGDSDGEATPRAGTYLYDDGSTENALGLTAGGEIVWIHHFARVAGQEVVTEIHTSYGQLGAGNSGVVPGQTIRLFIWGDPNGDGSPADAGGSVLLNTSTTAAAASIETDVLQIIPVTPTAVPVSFFIGASAVHAAGQFPAPMDQTAPLANQSWVDLDGTPPYNPAAVGAALNMTSIGFAADWLLRAFGQAPGGCPNGTCDPGENCQNCPADCGNCICGNNITEPGEQCDGTDDSLCPGLCNDATCECLGACCDGGSCTVTTDANCAGTWFLGNDCSVDPCPSNCPGLACGDQCPRDDCDLQVGITGGFAQECGDGQWVSLAFPFNTGGQTVDKITITHNTNTGSGDLYLMGDTGCQPDVNNILWTGCCAIEGAISGVAKDYCTGPIATGARTWVVCVYRSSFSFDVAYDDETTGTPNAGFGNLSGLGTPGQWQDLNNFGFGAAYCVDLGYSTGCTPNPYGCPIVIGACCDDATATCTEVEEQFCTGRYGGDNTNCAAPPFNPACGNGACCEVDPGLGGPCIPDLDQITCEAAFLGVWHQGQTCEQACPPPCDYDFDIAACPFSTTGTTVGGGNDTDEVCPYTGSTSEDVAYRFIPAADTFADITLCANSAYDTKLYVYEGEPCTTGAAIACNDDFCTTPSYAGPYVSQLEDVPMYAGNTYYIVVDGWSGASGAYTLDMTCAGPCDVTCPPGSTPEGEPDCFDGYVDSFNGGCNSTPQVFSPIVCGETVCGKGGTYIYNGLNYRDTDWYKVTLASPQDVTWTVEAEFSALIAMIEPDCGTVPAIATIPSCTVSSITASLGAGDHYLFVGTSAFSGIPCGKEYYATVTCGDVEPCTEDYVIPSCPYSTTGSTVGGGNDNDEVCPYSGSTSEDVIYLFSPAADTFADITLCANSDYDTKLYVYEDACVPGASIACNDDFCTTPSYLGPYVSQLDDVPMLAGHNYYIVVDGYGGASGNYTFDMTCSGPCDVVCPPGSTPEGEPDCADGYVDSFNGGCNSTPQVFSPISCNETVCGRGGTYIYNGLNYRDTDWYEFNLAAPATVFWTVEAEFGALIAMIEPDCATVPAITTIPSCTPSTISAALGAGTHYLFVATSGFSGVPCGKEYTATVTTDPACGGELETIACCSLHGAFYLCLDLPQGARGGPLPIEPRRWQPGDTQTYEITLSGPAGGAVTADASCTDGGNYAATSVVEGPPGTLTATWTPPLPNTECCTVTLSGGATGTADVRLLFGDASLNGAVNSADKNLINAEIGTFANTSAVFWYDMDRNNAINSADKNLANAQIGTALDAGCP